MGDRLEQHARTVWSLTLASRLTGLVRDGAISRILGPGPLASSFYFAFLVPSLFRRLFGEGALASAFLPAYTKLREEDRGIAAGLASLTIASLVLLLGGIVLVVEGVLWALTFWGNSENLAAQLTMITLPYMPLVCVVAILGAMLQVHGRFGPPAAAPIILNGLMIAALLGWNAQHSEPSTGTVQWLGAAVVAAGALQVAWCLLSLRGSGWWTRNWAPATDAMRQVLRQSLPMILGLGTLQVNTLIDGLIASWPVIGGDTILGVAYPLVEGDMASLTFAQRLYQFPLGVFGIAVATAIFPLLARQASDADAFAATLRRGLRLVVFIGLPAGAGLLLVREPLAAAVFQGGVFDAGDAMTVAFILAGYAPAVWAYSMTHVLTRAFYARGDAITPVRVALAIVVINLVLNLVLIWTPLNISGLAWSTALCAVIQVAVLLRLARRHVQRPVDEVVVGSWCRTLVLAAAMTAAVAAATPLAWTEGGSWTDSLWALAILVPLGIAVVGLGGLLLGMPEVRWAIGRR